MSDGRTGYPPLRYHEATKNSPASVRASTHRIDWMDQPEPFKSYLALEPRPLPRPGPDTGYPAGPALLEQPGPARPLDAAELARLIVTAAGVRRVRKQPSGRPLHLRAYACVGALYPIEVYLACSEVDGLEPGLYHYNPRDDALRQLRAGDPRPWLVRAAGGRDAVARAPVTVVLSGICWRTAWKYRARGYRHLFWDAGMLLANLLALAASGGHPSEVVLGFADSEIDALIGIDGTREMTICLVPVGFSADRPAASPAQAPADPIDHPVGRLCFRDRVYDEVVEAQRVSRLDNPSEAELWQQEPFPGRAPPPPGLPAEGVEHLIRRRGSKRRFAPDPITREQLEGVIAHATYTLACDWGLGLTQIGLVAHAVEGLEPGSYSAVFGLEPITLGDLRDKARFLCLDQDLGGDAAATLFLITDLEDASATLGERGYRAAQLNAGIVGGRLYLGAHAGGFGATGLTFYDDEVRRFFATEAEPMLAVALGR